MEEAEGEVVECYHESVTGLEAETRPVAWPDTPGESEIQEI